MALSMQHLFGVLAGARRDTPTGFGRGSVPRYIFAWLYNKSQGQLHSIVSAAPANLDFCVAIECRRLQSLNCVSLLLCSLPTSIVPKARELCVGSCKAVLRKHADLLD